MLVCVADSIEDTVEDSVLYDDSVGVLVSVWYDDVVEEIVG